MDVVGGIYPTINPGGYEERKLDKDMTAISFVKEAQVAFLASIRSRRKERALSVILSVAD